MKLRFTVNFGEVEITNFSKPLVVVVDAREFKKFMKHVDAEGKLGFSEIVVYNPAEFGLNDFHVQDDTSKVYELKFTVSEIESGVYVQNKDMIPTFFDKLWSKVEKAWEKYEKCLEKKSGDECEEPLTKYYYRVIFVFDPEIKTISKMYLEKVLVSSSSIVALRYLVTHPETMIMVLDG